MFNFIRKRPVVTIMSIAVFALISLLTFAFVSTDNMFEFVYQNLPIFIFGSVLFMIPIFANTTNDTLKIDLIDQNMVNNLRLYYGNYDNYQNNPFFMIFSRLYLELADQRSHATKNLALGVGFTVVAVVLSVLLVVVTQSVSVQSFELKQYLTTFLLPKVAVIIFIESIALFFLKWYGRNLEKMTKISDKMLIIELKLVAQYTLKQELPEQKILIEDILKTNIKEEEKILKKKDSLISEKILLKLLDKLNINLSNTK